MIYLRELAAILWRTSSLTVYPRRNGGHHEHQQKREPKRPPFRRPGLLPAQEKQKRQVRQKGRLKQLRGQIARQRRHRPSRDIPDSGGCRESHSRIHHTQLRRGSPSLPLPRSAGNVAVKACRRGPAERCAVTQSVTLAGRATSPQRRRAATGDGDIGSERGALLEHQRGKACGGRV